MSQSLTGIYFDGQTSAKQAVVASVVGNTLQLQGQGWQQNFPITEVRLTEASSRGPLLAYLGMQASCEFPSSQPARELLKRAGARDNRRAAFVTIFERDWRLVAMSISFLIAAIAAFYVWILPQLAEVAAPMVPMAVQHQIGQTVMRQIEEKWFAPSQLPEDQQAAIRGRFQVLVSAKKYAPGEKPILYIRKSRVGPNAFALPGNIIVLTDEMVTLVDGDINSISGVLAHELGHIEHRHSLRKLFQATALAVLGSAVIGDYSSVLATIPATLGQLQYSRRFEVEADEYARKLLCSRRIDPSGTGRMFEHLAKHVESDLQHTIPEFLLSHPGTPARAQYFLKPC